MERAPPQVRPEEYSGISQGRTEEESRSTGVLESRRDHSATRDPMSSQAAYRRDLPVILGG